MLSAEHLAIPTGQLTYGCLSQSPQAWPCTLGYWQGGGEGRGQARQEEVL